MRPLWLLALVLTAGPPSAPKRAPAPAAPAADAPRRSGLTTATTPAAAPSHEGEDTRCESCHSVRQWSEVVFPHEKTGFPLKGRHASAPCRTCHVAGFKQPIAARCVGCHRDPHAGQLGPSCEGCHDERSFRGAFSPEAHRRTAFPLTGRHVSVPCRECHPVARDSTFSRPTPECIECHADHFVAAEAKVSHQALGFGNECRRCHDTWRFQGARWEAHEPCFNIVRGAHAGIRCLDCHFQLTGVVATGTCASGTATCSRCHDKGKMDLAHTGNPGYRYRDVDCVQCHRGNTP